MSSNGSVDLLNCVGWIGKVILKAAWTLGVYCCSRYSCVFDDVDIE